MTLPSSGPLAASMIRDEFDGVNPFVFSDYYAGGLYVPAGTVGDSGPIPSSGTLKFSDFYGASNTVEEPHTITIGVQGNILGYIDGVIGALTPDLIAGALCTQLTTEDAATDFITVTIVGNLAQNYWESMAIEDGPTVLAANADTYNQSGGSTIWTFNNNYSFFGFSNRAIIFRVPG